MGYVSDGYVWNSGIRGRVGTTVTAELALGRPRRRLGGSGTVVVGRDVRESGRMLVDALTAGLRECGADVLTVGVESTPTIARAVELFDADAGVVVTASHNPAPDNGIKLWTRSGKAFGPDRRRAIERRIRDGDYEPVPGTNSAFADAVSERGRPTPNASQAQSTWKERRT